jgi:hypothetical protein
MKSRSNPKHHHLPTDGPDALDALAQEWHREARASERLTAAVREGIRTRPRVLPRYLVPAAVTACALTLLGGSIGISVLRPPSAAAIASVRQAMQQVRTARWTQETITRTLPSGTVLRRVQGTTTVDFIRLAARVETEPDEVYIRTRKGAYWKRNGQEIPDKRTVTETELAKDLRRRLFPEARMQGREADWRFQDEVWEGGHRLRHFTWTPSADAPVAVDTKMEDEFWVDLATNRIVATVYRVQRQEGKQTVEDVFTTRDYQYDLPVPESLFQLDNVAGGAVVPRGTTNGSIR